MLIRRYVCEIGKIKSMSTVTVIDYGIGNIRSVQRGFEKIGSKVLITSEPKKIESADYLVLPGVGAFKDGIDGLRTLNLVSSINSFVKKGNPLLGICLGMQMLMDESEENGKFNGLGYIEGKVLKIPSQSKSQLIRKIPHIGWEKLSPSSSSINSNNWSGTILNTVQKDSYFYFVHSYMAKPDKDEHLIATAEYSDFLVSAVIRKENVTGVQFHPEKSGSDGLEILKQFLSL